jgi:predicted Holliday junction resolvase-like endonuclease
MWYLAGAVSLAAIAVISWVCYRLIDLRANLKFERWKAAHSKAISRDAIRGSQSAISGRVMERLTPYLPDFEFNPRDARFLGDPVDFVVFDGLTEGRLRRVVFVEVKSGRSDLNRNERKVRDIVAARQVEWSLVHLPDEERANRLSSAR